MLLLELKKHNLNFFKNLALLREINSRNEFRQSTQRNPLDDRQIRALRADIDISGYLMRFGSTVNFAVIDKIEKDLKVRTKIWRGKRVKQKWSVELVWESDNLDGLELNLYTKNFDPFVDQNFDDFSLILNLEDFLKKKNYCPLQNTPRKRKMTLFQCLVTKKFPNLWGNSFEAKVLELQSNWGKNFFSLAENRRFYGLYGYGLEVWDLTHENGRKVHRKVFDSIWKSKIVVEIENFSVKNPKIPLDQPIIFVPTLANIHLHFCPKKGCFFGTDRYDRWQKHISGCRSETVVEYKQVKYDRDNLITKKELFEAGFLPSMEWENRAFLVWDVESLMEPVSVGVNRSSAIHRLSTIALGMSFSPDSELELVCHHRDSMDGKDLKLLIEKFWKSVERFRERMVKNLPKQVLNGLSVLEKYTKGVTFKSSNPDEKAKTLRQMRFLKDLLVAKCYSWNGESYDHNMILGPLINYFQQDKTKFQKIHCIKRGSGYMQIEFDGIVLRDMMNFTPPMSLSK